MVRYFYAGTPLAIVFGTAILLTIPYLAVIALIVVALALLGAIAWAIAAATHMLVRAVGRRLQGGRHAIGPLAAALHVARRGIDSQKPQLVLSEDATLRKEGV